MAYWRRTKGIRFILVPADTPICSTSTGQEEELNLLLSELNKKFSSLIKLHAIKENILVSPNESSSYQKCNATVVNNNNFNKIINA